MTNAPSNVRARLRHLLVGVGALALVGVTPVVAGAVPSEPAARFIVVLHDGADARSVAAEHARNTGVRPRYVYEHALKGYAADMTAGQHGAVARDGRVDYIERDGVATASITTQTGATWGLDRIDQRSLPLSGTYTHTNTGTGVTAYIIDSGIDSSHAEFGVRAVRGFDAFGGSGDDCNGHGTHVAGTVGGTTYGVAKAVSLVGVRVLDCGGSGSWSGVIAGMDWVTDQHAAGTPAVANLSLGGGASTAVDDAVKGMIGDGVASAVAAGNGNQGGREQDACKYSPARVPEAMTIGATTRTDAKTSWSNYGACVDWFAPGAGITSAWIGGGSTETNTISGTSMATPHVAGVSALYLQSNSSASPAQVRTALFDLTTKRIVTSSKTTNNHLLFTNL
ncbi:MAG TPA: S8 family peptidase [Acidimicrobiales bacterium]|nr:S8 family peptidase [Acidimicrobiales bacterium]